jgi:hypothetical protein
MKYPSEAWIIGLFIFFMFLLGLLGFIQTNPHVELSQPAKSYFNDLCVMPSGLSDRCLFGDHQQDI